MLVRSLVTALLLLLLGCQAKERNSEQVSHSASADDTGAALQVALAHWFTSGCTNTAGSDAVRIEGVTMDESKYFSIAGTKLAVVSADEVVHDDPDPEPRDHWIRIFQVDVSRHAACLGFFAKQPTYHKWATVTYRLRRSSDGWEVTSCGSGM